MLKKLVGCIVGDEWVYILYIMDFSVPNLEAHILTNSYYCGQNKLYLSLKNTQISDKYTSYSTYLFMLFFGFWLINQKKNYIGEFASCLLEVEILKHIFSYFFGL